FHHGGVLVDADSECVQPLPDWMLAGSEFAHCENEVVRPGLIGNGAVGALKHSRLMAAIVDQIAKSDMPNDKMAWELVGPVAITSAWERLQYIDLTIYPSHFFCPRHLSGLEYK